MKKIIIMMLLTLISVIGLVSALPSNFYEPTLLNTVNSSICNDQLIGSYNNIYYCTYDTGSTTYLRSVTENNNILQSINLGNINAQDGYVNDNGILTIGYTTTNTAIRFYDVTNNLNMQYLNSTSITGAYNVQLMFYYDNVFYYNYKNELRALSITNGLITNELVSSISVNNHFIDVKTFGGSKYYSIEDYILNQDYNVVASGSSGGDWFFINNNLGIKKDGTLINLNDLSDVITLAFGCNNFNVVYPYNSNYVLGINTLNNNWAVCDVSELSNIIIKDISLNVTSVPEAYSFFGANENDAYMWQISSTEEPAVEIISNNYPVGNAEFIGLDENNKFLFRVNIEDDEGGQAFYAITYDEITGSSTTTNIINFDVANSLDYVNSNFCNSSYSLTTNSPYYPYGTDGMLLFNSSNCISDFNINQELEGFTGGIVDYSTSFFYDYPITSGNYTSSVSLYDNDNLIKQFILLINYDLHEINIYHSNGTLIGNFSSSSVIVLDGVINTFEDNMTYSFRDGHDTYEGSLNLGININDVNKYYFNQYSTADLYTYIDYTSLSYSSATTEYLPTYLSFGLITAGETTTKVVRKDNDGLGDYEAYLYFTDSEHGTNDYSQSYYFTFTVDANTPILSEEEINSLLSSEGFIEGDVVTDKMEYWLNRLGFKSTGSRMIVGLIIMILTIAFLYGLGSEVILVGMAAEFVVFAYIGLFPTWLTALIVIISAGMVAIAFRKTVTGGS